MGAVPMDVRNWFLKNRFAVKSVSYLSSVTLYLGYDGYDLSMKTDIIIIFLQTNASRMDAER